MRLTSTVVFLFFIHICFCRQISDAQHTDTVFINEHKPLSGENVIIKEIPQETPHFTLDSLFSEKLNNGAINNIQQIRNPNREFILPLLMLLMLAYLTWIRYQYPKELSENISVIYNMNLAQQIFRDREYSLSIFTMLTFINFSVVSGVFLYILTKYYAVNLPFHSEVINIVLCIVCIVALYFVKSIFYKLLSLVYNFGQTLSFFRFNSLVLYQMAGFVFLPLVVLAGIVEEPVKKWVIIVTLCLIGILILIRTIKGLLIGASFLKLRIVYFLLYLCAFEIAPLLILYKVFTMWA